MTLEEPEVDDEGKEIRQKIKVDKKDEMRVIAYIQAISQTILNISTTTTGEIDADTAMKLIAATMSSLSEYLFNSTWKIQKAATSAINLIVSHGLSKVATRGA